MIFEGSTRAVCRIATTALSTALSPGRFVVPQLLPDAPDVELAGLDAYRAPSLAAAVTVPQVLNAKPNQRMAKINKNTKGKTTAASAISEPRESQSASRTRRVPLRIKLNAFLKIRPKSAA